MVTHMFDSVTGFKPTGKLHLGNYLGAIRPALVHPGFIFVADYHAMTTIHNPDILKENTLNAVATLMALEENPGEQIIYRQSDIPEIMELVWFFSTLIPQGLLDRNHTMKQTRDRGESANVATYLYPVLMAADILGIRAEYVPVGKDQRQHLEIAQIIASKINHYCGRKAVPVPKSLISGVGVIPGTDGQKMSKSYGNTIPLFLPPKDLKRAVMGITTDSTPLADPKNPDTCIVFTLYKHFATAEEVAEMKNAYQRGGYGYGHAKLELIRVIERELGEARENFYSIYRCPDVIEQRLEWGSAIVSKRVGETVGEIRQSMGLG